MQNSNHFLKCTYNRIIIYYILLTIGGKKMLNTVYTLKHGFWIKTNETDFDLVVFAGKIRGNNILGG